MRKTMTHQQGPINLNDIPEKDRERVRGFMQANGYPAAASQGQQNQGGSKTTGQSTP